LLEEIRSSVSPSPLSLQNVVFRTRLLWSRTRSRVVTNPLLSVVLLFVFVFALTSLLLLVGADASEIERVVGSVASLGENTPFFEWFDNVLQPVFVAVSGFVAVLAASPLIGAIRAIGVSPMKLLASGRSRAKAEVAFRVSFAREFREVTECLRPSRLAVFIDDLDRCRPEDVVEMLNTANYLVSSGPVIVVLGCDLDYVETCVRLHYQELTEASAHERHEADADADLHTDQGSATLSAVEREVPFAKLYMQKLVNLEIKVPKPTPEQAEAIATGQVPQDAASESSTHTSRWERVARVVSRRGPALVRGLLTTAVFTGVFVFAVALASQVFDQSPATDSRPPGSRATIPRAVAPEPLQDRPVVGGESSGANDEPRSVGLTSIPRVTGDSRERRDLVPWSVGVGFAFAAIWVGVIAYSRKQPILIKDSDGFESTLREWIGLRNSPEPPTPREQKRFMNKMRYFAMRSRTVSEAELQPDDRDRVIVALTTIQSRFPDWMAEEELWMNFGASLKRRKANLPEEIDPESYPADISPLREPFGALSREFGAGVAIQSEV
ncbi:MAG: P-loop NTPase fold protein, partial [Planctomycetota bacterium]